MVGGALKSASMDDFDLRMSKEVEPLYEAVKDFIRTEVDPITLDVGLEFVDVDPFDLQVIERESLGDFEL